MVNFNWCRKQERGISLISRKPHLSEQYMKDARESLKVCMNSEGKWRVITGYYACYNAFYSILMRCGIKSEIHDCTIKLMDLFGFSVEEINFLEKLKRDRIQGQYYLKKVELINVLFIKEFILKCEEILNKLNDDLIKEIRGRLNKKI
jgi:uncharacterized protein (UPF0332 family)